MLRKFLIKFLINNFYNVYQLNKKLEIDEKKYF